ncbi:SMP-30/gluconolactonase/LRE family protein [Cryptosporangium sp. NPDC051539]|uniref:SMP-30/gluconolactonase/LRE family protein n=1 Tax=Cryptosporangium sp. NPDC051539 TaxID=3363962 RepID=UPI0037989B33
METKLSGLIVGESPRWHDGHLWFAHWGANEIVRLRPDGSPEVMARPSKPAGVCIDWLPDGRLVVTGNDELLVLDADGALKTHTDLTGYGEGGWNEIVVDGRGTIYLNYVGFQFGREEFRPGGIVMIRPDGTVQHLADDIAFPNGMVVTPDNSSLVIAESWANRLTAFDIADDGTLSGRRTWADVGGDGICLDAEGAIWCAGTREGGATVNRVADGGEILEQFELDAACFACMLGGEQGTTLYLMVAEWRGVENMGELFTSRTGRILTREVTVPRAGRP